jgi:septum formation protein
MLARLGYELSVRPVDLDESQRPGEDALHYVRRLAEAKARAAARPGEIVLAADTIVVLDGELLGKPRDAAEAAAMLRRLAGREHEVSTGVATFDVDAGELEVGVDTTRVRFAPLTEAEIAWYVATGEPMDKAGAYAIQELASLFVTAIEGNHSNVVGLPMPMVYRMLAGQGMRPGVSD